MLACRLVGCVVRPVPLVSGCCSLLVSFSFSVLSPFCALSSPLSRSALPQPVFSLIPPFNTRDVEENWHVSEGATWAESMVLSPWLYAVGFCSGTPL